MITRSLLASFVLATAASTADAQPDTPQRASRLFAMQSNFWVNLHHFLYVQARAGKGLDASRVAVTSSLSDTAGLGALDRNARRAWDESLDYYKRSVADKDILFDTAMVVVNARLSDLSSTGSPRAAGLDAEHGRVLERAAPAYRAVWWTRHDAANKQWIAAVTPMIVQFGDSAAAWELRAFDNPWPNAAVRTDVTAYANWAGAYTTDGPDHITISSLNADNQGTDAFEMMFHEVLHLMDRRLNERIQAVATALGKRAPRATTHAMIFYSAGEITRRFYPSHVPYAEEGGLWARSRDMGPLLPLLQRHWKPWLDGQITLDDAIRRIVGEL